MLEIKFVRQNLPEVQKALSMRGVTADLETFKNCDTKRKAVLLEIENLRHRRNVFSEQIAGMKKDGKDADDLVAEMREVAGRIKELEQSLSANERKKIKSNTLC